MLFWLEEIGVEAAMILADRHRRRHRSSWRDVVVARRWLRREKAGARRHGDSRVVRRSRLRIATPRSRAASDGERG